MKLHTHLLAAVFAAALCSCNGPGSGAGIPYDELSPLTADELWTVFCNMPESVLPEYLKEPGNRAGFRTKFTEMQDGVLGDGEGFMDRWAKSDNSIYWSDYFTQPDDYDWSAHEDDQSVHPYINLHAYQGKDNAEVFVVLERGSFADDNDNKEPDKYFWYNKENGKFSPAGLKMDKPYTESDLTEDPLLLYGSENLFYAIQDKHYYPVYGDRGFQVFIEDVGMSGVKYEWNGNSFIRKTGESSMCLYNYGFGSSISMGDPVPFSVPGYKTEEASVSGQFETLYNLVKDGEEEPTLVFHADPSINITGIEVCSPRYSNVYGIHPGMPVSEFMQIVADINADYDEPTYTSIVEGDIFIEIYTGFDEDFVYKVRKDEYLGSEQFRPDARIARVMLTNAVG